MFSLTRISVGPFDLQTFPAREQLQEQFFCNVCSEPYNCLFKNASVINAIPDPDVPSQCDAASEEYSVLLCLVVPIS